MRIWTSAQFLLRILRIRLTGRGLPVTVILNVTNRCNCRCRHCYAGYPGRDSSREMSSEQAKRLLSDLRDNGCLRVSFSGGEPLLRSDMGDLIECARSLGLSVTLNSNGILVPRHLDMLRNVEALAISLDGRPEHHDILRGQGTGEKALEAVKAAVVAGVPVRVNMVLNKHNLDDVDYMLALAHQHGFAMEFGLAISNLYGEGASPEEVKPANEDFRRSLRSIIGKKKAGEPILFSAAAYESVLDSWQDFGVEGVLGRPAPPGMPDCPAGRLFCLIDADGTLWACPHLIGKVAAKNALEVGVAEAWRVATTHPCRGCYQVYHHEFALLARLSPRVLWNYFMSVVRN